MAKFQKNGAVKATMIISTNEKVSAALKLAACHAKRQLALQGVKLPTQTWTKPAIRNATN